MQYDIKEERSSVQRRIVNYIVRNSEASQELNPDDLSSSFLKSIVEHVQASYSNDIIVTPEVIKAKYEGQLKSDKERLFFNEMIDSESLNKDEFRYFLHKLKEINAKDYLINTSKLIHSRVLSGDSVKDICSIGTHITELASAISPDRKTEYIGDALESTMKNITEMMTTDAVRGIPYPIPSLRTHLDSMYPTDLVVIAARPAVGKTALAANIAYQSEEGGFGIFSTEMSLNQVANRWLSMRTGIDNKKLRNPKLLSSDELKELNRAAAALKGRSFAIEDKGDIDIGEIERTAEKWAKVDGIKVIFVDYIQRILGDKRYSGDVERISDITRRLKNLAKKLDICVVAIAQINRENQKDGRNRRPTMSDIKGCGDIEQEADIIILLHKPSMGTEAANDPCVVEAILDKNRHGPIGIIPLSYDPKHIHFSDVSDELYNAAYG